MKTTEVGKRWLVRFEAGEKLPESLLALTTQENWNSGSISGLGGVKNVALAYYDLSARQYVPIPVEGIVELVSLVGNLARVEGKPFWHLHAAVAGPDGRVLGGHLLSLEVAITLEAWIEPSSTVVMRSRDDFSGLNLLNLR